MRGDISPLTPERDMKQDYTSELPDSGLGNMTSNTPSGHMLPVSNDKIERSNTPQMKGK